MGKKKKQCEDVNDDINVNYVPEILRSCADIFEQRDDEYGSAYKKHGAIMKSLFPHGIKISSSDEFNRFGIINMMASKLSRYTNNFYHGGHDDSLLDLSVYATMLLELDRSCEND